VLTSVFTRLFVSQSRKVQFVNAYTKQGASSVGGSTHQAHQSFTKGAGFTCHRRSQVAPDGARAHRNSASVMLAGWSLMTPAQPQGCTHLQHAFLGRLEVA
jgi:hypothetical protein